MSVDGFNAGPANLFLACPLTKTDRRIPSHVLVSPPDGGLKVQSYVLTEMLRSLSRDRLIRRMGAVRPDTMTAVETRMRILLGL
jgi:mRNA interferase MazF